MSASCTLLLRFALNKMQDGRMSLGSCTSILVQAPTQTGLKSMSMGKWKCTIYSCNSSKNHPVARNRDSHGEVHTLSRKIVTRSRVLTPHEVATRDACHIIYD